MTAHDRYLALLREGETAGMTYRRLGDYIAAQLTPEELRELLREYVVHQPAPPTTEAAP